MRLLWKSRGEEDGRTALELGSQAGGGPLAPVAIALVPKLRFTIERYALESCPCVPTTAVEQGRGNPAFDKIRWLLIELSERIAAL